MAIFTSKGEIVPGNAPSSNALTTQEFYFMLNHGYTVRKQWISSREGHKYRVSKKGQERVVVYRKSLREAYNFIVKEVKQ